VVLCVWAANWYRRTAPERNAGSAIPAGRKWLIAGSIAVVALAGGLVRMALAAASSGFAHSREQVIGDGVVTVMALAWWMLVAYGAVISVRRTSGVHV